MYQPNKLKKREKPDKLDKPDIPDGTPQKLLDVSFLHSLGWTHRTPFEEALRLTYKDFLQQMSINKSDRAAYKTTRQAGENPVRSIPILDL